MMKYKVIVVDDEMAVFDMMKKYIENTSKKFFVDGCFINGKEAWEYINDNHVDVVITDIRMPIMSGLELAERIYTNKMDINVILLSAYDEFEYAQKGIEYGVYRYIMKPIDWEIFDEVLLKLEEKLDDKYSQEDIESRREEFFMDILALHEMSENEIKQKLSLLNFDTQGVVFCAYKLEYRNYYDVLNKQWNYEKERFYDAILCVLKTIVNLNKKDCLIPLFTDNESTVVLLISDRHVDNIDVKFVEELKKIVNIEAKCSLIFEERNISEIGKIIEIFPADELRNLMRFYISEGRSEDAKKIIKILMNRDTKEFGNYDSEEIYLELSKKKDKDDIIKMAKDYMDKNYNKDISRNDVAETVGLNGAYFGRYFKNETGMTIADYLLRKRIEKAKEYLKQDVLIKDIAGKVGYLNLRHFQRTFKKVTGQSLTSYRESMLKEHMKEE